MKRPDEFSRFTPASNVHEPGRFGRFKTLDQRRQAFAMLQQRLMRRKQLSLQMQEANKPEQ